MIRKQVYITEAQSRLLARRARQSGRSQSELIREAIDRLGAATEQEVRSAVLRETAGLWKDRDDLPDWEALRAESDRLLAARLRPAPRHVRHRRDDRGHRCGARYEAGDA